MAKKRVIGLLLGAAGLPAALVLGLLAWASAAGWLEPALLLQDMAAGDGGPSLLRHLRPEPQRQAVEWVDRGRIFRADRYQSGAAQPRGGLVLMPGAAPQGKDDPRLTAFARSLARGGFDVLLPDVPELAQLRVGPELSQYVVQSARFLTNVTGRKTGVAAVSFASGPAVLAALQERSIAYITAIGGYYDAVAAITYVTTGAVRTDGGWQRRTPNVYGRWVFLIGNVSRLGDAWDQGMLAAIAERRMQDPAAEVDDLVANLRPEGQAVWALLSNQDPDRVPALIDALPPKIRDDIMALDLRQADLSRLRADLILVHGAEDAIIPVEQSRALAKAVPFAQLYVVSNIPHAAIIGGNLSDFLDLIRAIRAVMQAGEATA